MDKLSSKPSNIVISGKCPQIGLAYVWFAPKSFDSVENDYD